MSPAREARALSAGRSRSVDAVAAAAFSLAVAVAAAGALLLFGHLNHDVAWLLVAAGRLAAGGRYGLDLVEPTPPLALVVMAPALALRDLAGIALYPAYLAWVCVLVAGAAALSRPMLRAALGRAADGPLPEAWLVAPALALLPGYDFGQKEHLFAVLATPAVLLFAARGPVAPAPALAALVIGAVAVLMKPYWLVVPAVVAAAALAERRLDRRRAAQAAAMFAVAAAGVVAGTLAWFGEWLAVARLAVDVYAAYDLAPVALAATAAAYAGMVALAWFAAGQAAPGDGAVRTLLVAAGAAVVAAAAQLKGWPYHYLPAVLFAALATGIALVNGARRSRAASLTLAALIAAVAFTPLTRAFAPEPADVAEFREMVRRHAAGQRFLALDTDLWPAFPAAVEAGARWASRAPAQWLVPGAAALVAGDAAARARADAVRTQALDMLAEDLARYRPAVIAVRIAPPFRGLPDGFDLAGWLRQDPRIAAALDGCRPVARGAAWTFCRTGG
ncbi:MAG: hypothetical protein AB7K86_06295 [Rhodospirillales bacterium]